MPSLHSRHTVQRSVPTRDLVIAFAITGTLIIATVATAAVDAMPRTGAAILDLGLLGLAGRRQQPLPAAVATVVVVITSVLTAPGAIKLPVVAAVALVAYTLARYESGYRLLAGFLICAGGVGAARLLLPAAHAHGVTILQLEVVVVVLPAVLAALVRVRGRLPALLGPDFTAETVRTADSSGDPASGLERLASWGEFMLANRDRVLCAVAAGLVLLVPLLDGGDTGTLSRDILVVGLAVVGVGSVGLIGRWPLPALLITLVAAVSFSGIATLPDAYDSVIGGVVVIGLPLIVGGLLRQRPALIALGACGAAIIVMSLVDRAGDLSATGRSTTTYPEVLSSVALAVGAWSTGRVLRRGGLIAGTGVIATALPAPGAASVPKLFPDAGELVQRAGLLGLRPTTVRVDQLHGEGLPHQIGEVIRHVLDEALDNAARHAPGADLMIKVLHDPNAIRIEVINGRAVAHTTKSAGPGRGVPELANRIAGIGGMFCVGPTSGGFALRARLPIKTLPTKALEVDSPGLDNNTGIEAQAG